MERAMAELSHTQRAHPGAPHRGGQQPKADVGARDASEASGSGAARRLCWLPPRPPAHAAVGHSCLGEVRADVRPRSLPRPPSLRGRALGLSPPQRCQMHQPSAIKRCDVQIAGLPLIEWGGATAWRRPRWGQDRDPQPQGWIALAGQGSPACLAACCSGKCLSVETSEAVFRGLGKGL